MLIITMHIIVTHSIKRIFCGTNPIIDYLQKFPCNHCLDAGTHFASLFGMQDRENQVISGGMQDRNMIAWHLSH